MLCGCLHVNGAEWFHVRGLGFWCVCQVRGEVLICGPELVNDWHLLVKTSSVKVWGAFHLLHLTSTRCLRVFMRYSYFHHSSPIAITYYRSQEKCVKFNCVTWPLSYSLFCIKTITGQVHRRGGPNMHRNREIYTHTSTCTSIWWRPNTCLSLKMSVQKQCVNDSFTVW